MASKLLNILLSSRLGKAVNAVVFVLVFFLFSSLYKIRRSKNIVGFASCYFNGNLKYLYEEMENYKGIKIYFVTRSKDELERLKSSNVNAYYYMDIKEIPLFLRTDVWVTSKGLACIPSFAYVHVIERFFGVPYAHARAKRGSKWVYVEHGLHYWSGLGKVLKDFDYDLGFVTSEFLKQYWGKEADISDRLRVSGFPRTDPLIKKNLDREKILKAIDIPLDKKNILYAPTCSSISKPFFPWKGFDQILKDIENFCEKNNCNFLIRMHPHWNRMEFEQKEKLEENMKLSKNIYYVPFEKYPDTELILYISDVLVTDWSSISNEFILLHRPTIFLDIETHYFPISPPPRHMHAFGYIVKNETEFFEKLQESLTSPNLFEKKRKKLLRELYECLDGNSSKRCAQEIIKLLERNSS